MRCFKNSSGRKLFHLLLRFSVLLYVLIAIYVSVYYEQERQRQYDFTRSYGYFLSVHFYFINSVIYLSIPFVCVGIIGILWYNPIPEEKQSQSLPARLPFVLFRVVTRGLYPNLVHDITKRNLDICKAVGLRNFQFEIVTDRVIYFPESHYVKETVVPAAYNTVNGTLFKARALQYSLDQTIDTLSPDDWVVHLDEETLLTQRVLVGISDFVSQPNTDIGQGVIVYGKCGVENWFTTLLDGLRTSIDYGLYRMAFQLFRCPLFGFKGSFIVVRMHVIEKIGYDFGPNASIAEDLMFALTAWSRGFKFDFIEGEMMEKSTFSISDFIKQRKRWFIGYFNIIWANSVPLKYKACILTMHVSNIFLWANLYKGILPWFLHIPLPLWHFILVAVTNAFIFFMFFFGNFMSLSEKDFSFCKRFVLSFLSQALLPISCALESYAAVKGLFDRSMLAFDIVDKEVSTNGLDIAVRSVESPMGEQNVVSTA